MVIYFLKPLKDSSSGVIEGCYDMGIDGLDLGFGLESSVEGDFMYYDDNYDLKNMVLLHMFGDDDEVGCLHFLCHKIRDLFIF